VKSSLILLAILISVFGISPGRAQQQQQTLDIAKITCEQFLTSPEWSSRELSIWLSGYYYGTRHDTVFDVGAAKQHSIDVLGYCTEHPEMNLMEAIQNAIGLKK
jgi:hypothetical protein